MTVVLVVEQRFFRILQEKRGSLSTMTEQIKREEGV